MKVQDVMVRNAGANPVASRLEDNPARQPFQKALVTGPVNPTPPLYVPKGKCLVIECVSGHVDLPTGNQVSDLCLQTTVGAETVGHRLPVTLLCSAGGNNRYVTCQMLRAYASPETTVGYSVCVSGPGAQSSILTISGHLVDVP